MKKYRLGVIGFGHMSSAIIRGALANEVLTVRNTGVCDTNPDRTAIAAEMGLDHCDDPAELCKDCEYVLFAVRPQDMPGMLESLRNVHIGNLLSIVTGWSLADIGKYVDTFSMIRIMPNTPMQVSHGAAFWSALPGTPEEAGHFVNELLSPMGLVSETEERFINLSCTVHGSTPAYFYYLVNVLINDAVKHGFDRKTVRDFITETMIGSGELLKANPDIAVEEFVDEVCSPGGATIEAINIFREKDIDAIITEANDRCLDRAEELGKH